MQTTPLVIYGYIIAYFFGDFKGFLKKYYILIVFLMKLCYNIEGFFNNNSICNFIIVKTGAFYDKIFKKATARKTYCGRLYACNFNRLAFFDASRKS